MNESKKGFPRNYLEKITKTRIKIRGSRHAIENEGSRFSLKKRFLNEASGMGSRLTIGQKDLEPPRGGVSVLANRSSQESICQKKRPIS